MTPPLISPTCQNVADLRAFRVTPCGKPAAFVLNAFGGSALCAECARTYAAPLTPYTPAEQDQ